MRTKHLYVLIHIRIKGGVGAGKHVLAIQWFFSECFLSGSFLLFMFHVSLCCAVFMLIFYHLCYFCLVLLCFHACLFADVLCYLLGKGWPLGSRLWCLIVTLSLSHWYPGSDVLLDCIDSWYLPYFLLCLFFVALWSQAWKRADLLALFCVICPCVLSLSLMVY